MNYYIPKQKQGEATLFKKELKFMDFFHVTYRYLSNTQLKDEAKTTMAVRIHNYALPMQEAINHYDFAKSKRKPECYQKIDAGLKETIRRAKISLAIKNNNNKLFVGYWKYLADVYREDAKLLQDEKLKHCIDKFESYIETMKA